MLQEYRQLLRFWRFYSCCRSGNRSSRWSNSSSRRIRSSNNNANRAVGIAIAAIAALTAGGIALYKHMQEDSIPTVNLFGDTVSEATQQAVGSFMG